MDDFFTKILMRIIISVWFITDINTVYVENKKYYSTGNEILDVDDQIKVSAVDRQSYFEELSEEADNYISSPLKEFWKMPFITPSKKPDFEELRVMPNYRKEDINHYIPFAGATYCGKPIWKNINCQHCKKIQNEMHYIDNEETDTRAILVSDDQKEEIVIAFRGSDTIEKLLHATAIKTVMYPGVENAWVQSNVYEFAKAIFPQISSLLKQEPFKIKLKRFRLVLVGHSFGGNLATLMAPLLMKEFNLNNSRMRVITYGQLRVGNREFATWYNNLILNYTRVVNNDDPAANFPSYEAGWTHVKRELFISEDGTYYDCYAREFESEKCGFNRGTKTGLFSSHEYVGGHVISDQGCWIGFYDFITFSFW